MGYGWWRDEVSDKYGQMKDLEIGTTFPIAIYLGFS